MKINDYVGKLVEFEIEVKLGPKGDWHRKILKAEVVGHGVNEQFDVPEPYLRISGYDLIDVWEIHPNKVVRVLGEHNGR